MTFGPKQSTHCASCMMRTCLVVQCVFSRNDCQMECPHPDGKEDPNKVCMQECLRGMQETHHWSSTSKRGTSPHSGTLHSTTGSLPQPQTLKKCQTSMQMNGPRCSEPAPSTLNLTMKRRNLICNQHNQPVGTTKKQHFDRGCWRPTH